MKNYLKNAWLSLFKNPRFALLKIRHFTIYFLKIPTHIPHPLNYQIEPSSKCNLACKMCAVKTDHSRFLPISASLFKIFLNNSKPIENINVSGLGEPLLNPNLNLFIRELSANGSYVFTISNSQLMTPQKINDLIKSGLKSIVISLESTDPITYEKIRVRGKFDTLVKSLRLLRQKTKDLKGFRIIINCLVFPSDLLKIDHYRQVIDFCHKLGLSDINFFIPDNVISSGTLKFYKQNYYQIASVSNQISAYAESKGVSVNLPRLINPEKQCTSPWMFPFVSVSGDVLPCCAILHLGLASGRTRQQIIDEYSFGNIFNSNIDDIWNSSRAIAFRRSFKTKKFDQYCLKCSRFYGFK